MPHPLEHDATRPLPADEAEALAEAMRVFGTASRLRLMWELLEGERTVDQLAAAVGIAPSTASHQLRLLRHSRLVSVRRVGRNAYYRLHDDHVGDLLRAVRSHQDHVVEPRDLLTARIDSGPVRARSR